MELIWEQEILENESIKIYKVLEFYFYNNYNDLLNPNE